MKLFVTLALAGLFVSQIASAVPEDQAFDTVVEYFNNEQTCANTGEPHWKLKVVEAPLGTVPASFGPYEHYNLRMSQFGCELGSKGALMIVPGRGEGSIEYVETALDYEAMGYSPVFVMDPRGQGMSPRLLPDVSAAHLGDFNDYVTDLEAATNEALRVLKNEFGRTDEPFYYTANSMGSAIGFGYFQRTGKNNPYSAAAMLGSMIYVNYAGFIDAKEEPVLKAALLAAGDGMEFLVHQLATERCNRGRCELYYAADQANGPYRPGTRKFIPNTEVIMTHSEARYNVRTYLWDQFNWSGLVASDYVGENFEGPQVGASTNQWVRETSGYNAQMRKRWNLRKMINIPMMLITGTRDLRAYKEFTKAKQWLRKKQGLPKTSLARHAHFCKKLNSVAKKFSGKESCTFVPMQGAFHEIYKESDQYRNLGFQLVDDFFQNN